MKAILGWTASLILLWSANAWAVAIIELNNYDANRPIFIYWPATLAPKDSTYVQLSYFNEQVNDFVVVTNTEGTSKITLSEPGYFDAGVGLLPGQAGNQIEYFELKAWRLADSYEDSFSTGLGRWSQYTGSWDENQVPPLPPVGPDLLVPPGFTIDVIPEPKSVLLLLMGSIVMVFSRLASRCRPAISSRRFMGSKHQA